MEPPVKLKLSRHEVLALIKLMEKPMKVSELADSLKVKRSFASRLVKDLEGKDFIIAKKEWNQKTISLSQYDHVESFKKLYNSRPDAHIEDWLSGTAMDILISMNDGESFLPLIVDAECSAPTLYKFLNKFYSAGIVSHQGKKYVLSDANVKDFVKSYVGRITSKLLGNIGYSNLVRAKTHVLIRTKSTEIPQFFIKTGLTYIIGHGVEARATEYNDYYFKISGMNRGVSKTDALIHALALSNSKEDYPILAKYLLILMNETTVNARLLKSEAELYGVESGLNELMIATGYYEKLRDME